MKIYNFSEAKMFGTVMSTTQLISSCVNDSQYHKELDKQMPDFCTYDYVLPYFLDALKVIKKCINEYCTLIDNTQKQIILSEMMTLLKENVHSDENGYSFFDEELVRHEGEPFIINNQKDAELLTTLVVMQDNIIFNASFGDPYYDALSKTFPSIFSARFKSKTMEEIACEICDFLTNDLFKLGAFPSSLLNNYKELQTLLNK